MSNSNPSRPKSAPHFAYTATRHVLGKTPQWAARVQGVAAMQSIDIVVINPLFMAAFVGTAVTCLALAVTAFARWSDGRAVWWLAGAVLYVVGCFAVTIVFNVQNQSAQ